MAQFSGSGNVTAPLATTSDITVPPPGGPGSGTSGCEREDWPAGDQPLAGKIALIQRGSCVFVNKIQLAADLGAAGVLVFNDGGPGREEPFQIGAPQFIGIPVVMTSATVGAALYALEPTRPASSAPHHANRTRLRGFALSSVISSAISISVPEPEPLSLMPGPSSTLSRCAPTTIVRSGSPESVSAMWPI